MVIDAHRPRTLTRLLVAAGLIVAVGLASCSDNPKRPPTRAEAIREHARARWAPWREAAANLFVISIELAAPGLLVFAAARAWRRRRFVKVGLRGHLPVLESDLSALSAEVLHSINAARKLRAQRSPGPRSLSQTLQLPAHERCPRCAAELAENPGEPRR